MHFGENYSTKCQHNYVCLQGKQTPPKRYTALVINVSHSTNYVRGKLWVDWLFLKLWILKQKADGIVYLYASHGCFSIVGGMLAKPAHVVTNCIIWLFWLKYIAAGKIRVWSPSDLLPLLLLSPMSCTIFIYLLPAITHRGLTNTSGTPMQEKLP